MKKVSRSNQMKVNTGKAGRSTKVDTGRIYRPQPKPNLSSDVKGHKGTGLDDYNLDVMTLDE